MSGIRRVSDLGSKGISNIIDGSIQASDLSPTIPLSGMRNLLINGDMRINQRNTAITGGIGYTVDRWYVNTGGGSGNTSTAQSTDVPSGSGFTHSLRVTSSGSVPSGARWLGQRIEAANCAVLSYGTPTPKPITISFWVRATTPGTYTVSLLNSSKLYAVPYTIIASDTWEYKTVTVTGDIALAISTVLDIRFVWYASGEYWGTQNEWRDGTTLVAAPNQVFSFGAGSIFAITGVQVEVGSQPTPFEQRPIGVELGLCQRYYERFQLDNAAITRTIGPGGWDSATSFSLSLMFKTLKRTTPTMSSSNSGFQVLYHGLAWYTGTTTTFTEPSVYGVRANIASSGSAVQGQAGIAVLANTSAFMAADSEL
jgi:hypothetical protein